MLLADEILLFGNVSVIYQDFAAVYRYASADDIQHGCLAGAVTSYY